MPRIRRLYSKLLIFFTTGSYFIISKYGHKYSSSDTDFKENIDVNDVDSITRSTTPFFQQNKREYYAFVDRNESRKEQVDGDNGIIFKNFPSPMRIVIEETKKYVHEHRVDLNQNNRSNIFIVTSWRSGSTFFGEMFNSHPAIFYHYEPLSRFGFKDLSIEKSALKEAISDIKNLAECEYEKLANYLDYAKKDPNVFKLNPKIERGCEYVGTNCYSPTFLKLMCNMFPVKLFKILRVNVSHLKTFLRSKSSQIILLVRDPRATYSSRRKLSWCTDVNLCMDLEHHCKVMRQDLSSINELKSEYPGQVHLVRYEDVAENPILEFKKIFQEVGIAWHHFVQMAIEYHTNREVNVPWSTYRISKTRIDKWKTELEPEMVSYVESSKN